MGSPASALGANGAPVKLDWSGGTITINPMTWGKVLTAMENELISEALDKKILGWQKLVDRGLISAAELDDRCAKFIQDADDNGSFAFGSPPMNAVMDLSDSIESGEVPKHMVLKRLKLFSLMIEQPEHVVLSVLSEKKTELMSKLFLVIKRSLPAGIELEGSDAPNLVGAAAQ